LGRHLGRSMRHPPRCEGVAARRAASSERGSLTAEPGKDPEISFVMPCFNEEQVLPYSIPRFIAAFQNAGIALELVACDNGSRDRTGTIIREFAERGLPVVPFRVEKNIGYGNRAPWIGIVPADGQVDAEDAVRLFQSVRDARRPVLGKVYRRFRLDGPLRAVVSFFYNAFVRVLWPGVRTFDVNGSPKILRRDSITAMQLSSTDWLLDPEIVIKAHLMGLPTLEMNVFSRMREHGTSNVRPATAWEFFRRLLGYRLGRELSRWRASLPRS
jgi:cellulose synthase/poly-beta-1,6-N-acetylglucosamine synthase-like glycosyltransferase